MLTVFKIPSHWEFLTDSKLHKNTGILMHTTQFEKENEQLSSSIKRLSYYYFFKISRSLILGIY